MSWITENLPFKVLSIALALFIWYLAKQGGEKIEMGFYVPLILSDLPSNMEVASETPSLSVLVRTTRRRSRDLTPSDIQAQLNLHKVEPGTVSYPITHKNILIPDGVTIVRITPPQVELKIESVIEKTLPVSVKTVGQIPKGYFLKQITVDPPMVDVRGPKSLLDSVDQLFTKTIPLDSVTRSTEVTVHLDLPSNKMQITNNDNNIYTAQVEVVGLPSKKNMEQIPIILQNSIYEAKVTPSTFNLQLEGPIDVLEKLDVSQLSGVIDLSHYSPGHYTVKPIVVLPNGQVRVTRQWPEVTLWVKRKNRSVAP